MPSCSSGFCVASTWKGAGSGWYLPAIDHAPLLHGLKQGRLGARAGAVDLVGHQKLGEDRALDEAERPAAAFGLFEDLGAENIGRHQVGRALDALILEAEHDAERLDQARLGQAGNADQQRVTPGQQRDKTLIDNVLLAEDDIANRLPGSDKHLTYIIYLLT